ncbi:MAG: VTT domain-containing protein [Patescibacteria group bacterium]|nr:VTT domain-containing protein [Patescibacteria group bacterium]MCL5224421.1 VTT domain-containing protein [Patescibacteria group bacterium]
MGSLLSSILSYVLVYRYAAIFVFNFGAAMILPLPMSATLLAVGAFSSQGYFNIWESLAVAVSSNVLGDLADYLLTRRYGATIIRKLKIDQSRFFVQFEEELRHDAAGTVFSSRFAGSLSSVVNLLAGFVGVPLLSFIIPDIIGDVIEPTVILFVGYILGIYWSNASDIFTLLAAVVATAVVLFVMFRIYRRMARRNGSL